MMTTITIGRAGDRHIPASLMDGMHRLRADVFHHRLGWDVEVVHGRERDGFDLLRPHYLLAHNAGHDRPRGSRVLGCCRVLPTLGPNMLRDVFPELADDHGIPARLDTWEVSRFAVAEEVCAGGYGFSALPARMVGHLLLFCASRRIGSLVGVTSAPFERMLLRLGLQVERLGRPRRIGRVMSLAFALPLDAGNLAVAGAIAAGNGIGPDRMPATLPRAA
ncbi:acyl-homoserine-lactone synthase [Marilutibacter alkalisoli]|uniref:Acyl-homoserine-lactone synthase n=1 Tax=Marilutibacter alkalisoli TaxID=2591633 RepID=A0A514BUQ6_9GAMM|nr:acyl-homoserine-lactone synthase [Lysobacter alkalisoli]QDH71055.1 acyl-homoserine-lactone synthase [Lysobacter alkalisoli]